MVYLISSSQLKIVIILYFYLFVLFCTWTGEISRVKKYELLMGIHPYPVKENFDLEEYSLSQSTLEQVGNSYWLNILLKIS